MGCEAQMSSQIDICVYRANLDSRNTIAHRHNLCDLLKSTKMHFYMHDMNWYTHVDIIAYICIKFGEIEQTKGLFELHSY